MKSQTLAVGVILMGGLVVALPAVASDQSKGPEPTPTLGQPIDPSDRGAESVLVEDLENPSDVAKRAEALLGARYVDVSINSSHTSFVVGVLDLAPDEARELEADLSGEALVSVEGRTVSSSAVDSLRRTVEEAVLKSDLPYSVIGSNLQDGSVLVGIDEASMVPDAVELLSSELPGWKAEDKAGDGVDLVPGASGKAAVHVRVVGTGRLTESKFDGPYRAGKAVGINVGANYSCTTGWFMHKNSKNFGSTAGHCARPVGNGASSYFAGSFKGDVQFDQFDAGKPNNIKADVLLYDLGNGGTRTLFRSPTLNRDVTGQYGLGDMVAGWRTCTRGAAWDEQSCGNLRANYVDATITADGFTLKNQYCWKWEPENDYRNIDGDSGAPVYRVRANESVWAAGIHSSIQDYASGDPGYDTSCFTGIVQVLNELDANLATQ